MSVPPVVDVRPFVRFGLIVTGRGEEQHLPLLFRSLTATGLCTFKVLRRIGQRSPITSPKRQLQMGKQGKLITDKDEVEIGLEARKYLTTHSNSFVLLIDDLEDDRAAKVNQVYRRYRDVLDRMLGPHKHRASVHFLANMLEAYFFANAKAVNAVLGTNLRDFTEDVEMIRHPKNELKAAFRGYDEIEHGGKILAQLDVPLVLSRVDTCASLRTMFAWCSQARTDLFQLAQGKYSPVTSPQMAAS